MNILLLVVRLLLAGVFGLAAITKFRDRAGAREAMRDFGVPAKLLAPLAIALPAVELAVAFFLLPTATAWWAAWIACGLLLAFSGGIGVNLLRGRRPACHCFGQLASHPIGWPVFARNVVLAAFAAIVAWRGDRPWEPVPLRWLADAANVERVSLAFGAIGLALGAATLLILVQMLGQHGRVLLRLDSMEARLGGREGVPAAGPVARDQPRAVSGLPVGTMAPPFQLPTLEGEPVALDGLLAEGKNLLLVFTDPHCGPCTALLPELVGWQRELAATVRLTAVSRGTPGLNRAQGDADRLRPTLLQHDVEVSELYKAYGTPSAVLVRADGTVGSALAEGAEAIRALVARLRAAVPATSPLRVGAPAPAVELQDRDGKTVPLAAFRGHATLLLFWNPGCTFCQQMLEPLRAWEASTAGNGPRLLVISSGSAEANGALGVRAPVLGDPAFVAGKLFGVQGTPSAILLDAAGRITSDVAVGAPAVLALAGSSTLQRATLHTLEGYDPVH